jgi:hypothetical protein
MEVCSGYKFDPSIAHQRLCRSTAVFARATGCRGLCVGLRSRRRWLRQPVIPREAEQAEDDFLRCLDGKPLDGVDILLGSGVQGQKPPAVGPLARATCVL